MSGRRSSVRSLTSRLLIGLAGFLVLSGVFAVPVVAGDAPPVDPRVAALSERHHAFLDEVEVLMTEVEREVFLAITSGYQRDAFIRRFWEVRDPFPQTERNELEERWHERSKKARELYGDLSSEKARLVLHFGEPTSRESISCDLLNDPVEVWSYFEGAEGVKGYFTLVFVGPKLSRGLGQHLWHSSDGLATLISPALRRGFPNNDQLWRLVSDQCARGDELLQALAQALEVDRAATAMEIPRPSGEWARSFIARSTEVPEGAPSFTARLETSFPGRHQNRTVVQGLILVPRDQLAIAELGDYRGYDLLVDGEILRKDELFDQFRYRFDFPAGGEQPQQLGDELPLVVQRYLRPGSYRLVLKVEDTNAERFYRQELDLEVPRVDSRQPLVAVGIDGSVTEVDEAELAALESDLEDESDGELAARAPTYLEPPPSRYGAELAEANASISTGDHMIRIRALPDVLMVGKLRVEARTRGDGIDRVAFELNGKPVMKKRRPPYSIELDLGTSPRIHTLRALALDESGALLAVDEVPINAGPHRFDIRLIEPQRGKAYRRSVRAHAQVEVPEGEQLDRVELYLNDTRVATLYQPPFEQPMLLAPDQGLTYVRALAFLRNGDVAEDVQFINAPDFVDEMRVNFVELYATVVDRKGAFVEDMQAADFVVKEEGETQKVRRFESMTNLPIRAGLVIDTSLSMAPVLADVERAAYQFLESVMTERDRAAVVTFADEPRLVARFTGDKTVLAGGLAGLDAEGETALFDAIIFTLHYFSGLKGKRAMVVLTDGEDSASHYPYEDAIEFARRTGVAIYVIGLGLPSSTQDVRTKLYALARETGGETFFIDGVYQLERVYEKIQQELRSQYLLAYQSTSTTEGFREVEVDIPSRRGLEAKTIRGYYP